MYMQHFSALALIFLLSCNAPEAKKKRTKNSDKEFVNHNLTEKITACSYKFLGDTLFLLYDNHSIELIGGMIKQKDADSIFLFNAVTKQAQGFQLPSEIGRNKYLYLKEITQKDFTVSLVPTKSNDSESLLIHSR